MFKNYFKVAWRNLVKNRVFSIINITGLATGLACFILISLYVLDELSYDKFYKNAERIYRINSDVRFGGTDLHMPVSSDMMGEVLRKDYPQVEQYTKVFTFSGSKMIRKGNEFINEYNVAHVDSTFFDVFQLTPVAGDIKTALNEPNTIVVTASAAKKYFGTEQAIGKTIETNDNNQTLYKVTGVIEDMPKNSHFGFDFLFSMDNVDYEWGSFLSHNFFTYLLLKKGSDPKVFEKKFDEYIDKYVVPQARQVMNIPSMEEFQKAGNSLQYSLIPLTDIHLKSNRSFELKPGGNVQYVYIFSGVALFILLIACINFMNLTTARSANRAKEVGIRKVLGTHRRKLVSQFLSESTLMAFLSMILALAIACLVLPLFNNVSGKSMTLGNLFAPLFLPVLILLPLVVGLLAGSYPAFYLSAFQPIQVLKGKLNSGARGGLLRSVLVTVQFVTTIILIIGTIVIYKQLDYIQTKNLGFNKSQVLVINDTYSLNNNIDAFRNEMLRVPGVLSATTSGFLPVTSTSRNDNTFSKEAVLDAKNGFNMQNWTIDENYVGTMGMEIVKGRNFSRSFPSDSSATIINESAAKALGYDDPVGKKLYTIKDVQTGEVQAFNIIGVVKNFHFESLKQSIGPLCFLYGRNTNLTSFKVTAANVPSILKQAEAKWKSMASGKPFSYRFMDDSFDEMYRAEQRVGKIAFVFSILAILIACLGLFGLVTFIAEQRAKEIGIRKVLGASVRGIVQLLSKDFIRLVLIAFVIAAPAAWYFMHHWLQDFAFRVQLTWWVFAAAGLIALGIAVLTLSVQAVRAALDNPVKNLRTE
jgi:putative ABC transport system permease protein